MALAAPEALAAPVATKARLALVTLLVAWVALAWVAVPWSWIQLRLSLNQRSCQAQI
jgi:hypothetical protein